MNDSKDALVTRPELDALIDNLREDPRDLGLVLQETMIAAADALAAERARADQAEIEAESLAAVLQEVDETAGDPEHPRFGRPDIRLRMRNIVSAVTEKLELRQALLERAETRLAAQTAEKGADQ
jgi:hypothetical protein